MDQNRFELFFLQNLKSFFLQNQKNFFINLITAKRIEIGTFLVY